MDTCLLIKFLADHSVGLYPSHGISRGGSPWSWLHE